MKLSEKHIQNSILAYLEHLPGCFAWRNNSTGVYDPKRKAFRKPMSKYSINGVSDILGVYNGRILAIEVKRPENKLRTDSQEHFINQIKFAGGIAFYATSVEDVEKNLKAFDAK